VNKLDSPEVEKQRALLTPDYNPPTTLRGLQNCEAILEYRKVSEAGGVGGILKGRTTLITTYIGVGSGEPFGSPE